MTSYAIVIAEWPYKYISVLDEVGKRITGYKLTDKKEEAKCFSFNRVISLIKQLRVLYPDFLWSCMEVSSRVR